VKVVFSSLVRIGRGAVPQLTAALKSENRTLRTTAALALAHIEPANDAPLPVLLDALNSSSWPVLPNDPWLDGLWEETKQVWHSHFPTSLRADEWALLKIGPRAVPQLVRRALEATGGGEQPYLETIGSMPHGGREALPNLIIALKHKDEATRARAAGFLGRLGSAAADAIPALGEAAGDAASSVRLAAEQSRDNILAQVAMEKQQAEARRQAARAHQPPGTVEVLAATPLKVDDAVSVEWNGGWYTGKILELPGADSIRIHYEGYESNWDETVPRSRLRLPAAPPQPAEKPEAAPKPPPTDDPFGG
jgi:hypothetical protein